MWFPTEDKWKRGKQQNNAGTPTKLRERKQRSWKAKHWHGCTMCISILQILWLSWGSSSIAVIQLIYLTREITLSGMKRVVFETFRIRKHFLQTMKIQRWMPLYSIHPRKSKQHFMILWPRSQVDTGFAPCDFRLQDQSWPHHGGRDGFYNVSRFSVWIFKARG